jgi:hypothetical protein
VLSIEGVEILPGRNRNLDVTDLVVTGICLIELLGKFAKILSRLSLITFSMQKLHGYSTRTKSSSTLPQTLSIELLNKTSVSKASK